MKSESKRTRYRAFMRKEDGSFAIEMAFILPIIILITFTTIEYGMMMYARNLVQAATAKAARSVMVGESSASVRKKLTENLNVLPNYVTYRGYTLTSPRDLIDLTPNRRGTTFSTSDRLIKMSVRVDMKILSPLMYLFLKNSNGIYQIESIAYVKTESF